MWIIGYTDIREQLFYNFVKHFTFICQMDSVFDDGKCNEIK